MRPGSVELLLYYPKIQLRLHSLSSRDWSWVMGPLPDCYGVPKWVAKFMVQSIMALLKSFSLTFSNLDPLPFRPGSTANKS